MKKPLIFACAIAIAITLHIATQYHAFSLFLAPLSIPLLLLFVHPFPLVVSIGVFVILEAFSSLFQGSMLVLFAVPFALRWVWGDVQPDITWKFFFFTLTAVCLQLAALTGISLIGVHNAGMGIPWAILGIQAITTTLGTCILAFLYHEYSS